MVCVTVRHRESILTVKISSHDTGVGVGWAVRERPWSRGRACDVAIAETVSIRWSKRTVLRHIC